MKYWLWVIALAAVVDGGGTDQVLLKDGRLLEGKIEDRNDGLYLTLANGTVRVPDEDIQETLKGDVESYQPKDDFEREQLKKGMVFFQGTWMSKARRDTILKQRVDQRKKRLDEMREHQDWAKALTAKTTHFDFKANCSQEVLDQYTKNIERYYDKFMKYWQIKLKPGSIKTRPLVSIYRNRSDFLKITKKPLGVLGYFDWTKEELHVYWESSDPEESWSVVFHEGNHLLTHLIDPTFLYPNWINEGMAEYYGASRFEGNDVKTGGSQPYRIVELKTDIEKGKEVRVEDLIQEASDSAANSYKSYNWGWSLMHFLMENPTYAPRIRKYFLSLAIGGDVKRTTKKYADITTTFQEVPGPEQLRLFQKMMGIADLGAFNKEWHDYIKGLIAKLDAKGLYFAAYAALREGKRDEAESALTKAFELGSKEPGAYFLRGQLSLLSGKFPKAQESFMQALDLDPINGRYTLMVGRVRQLMGKKDEGAKMEALAKELDPVGFESWGEDLKIVSGD
jgi:tetratricopeptide (TPR) repeat protein